MGTVGKNRRLFRSFSAMFFTAFATDRLNRRSIGPDVRSSKLRKSEYTYFPARQRRPRLINTGRKVRDLSGKGNEGGWNGSERYEMVVRSSSMDDSCVIWMPHLLHRKSVPDRHSLYSLALIRHL